MDTPNEPEPSTDAFKFVTVRDLQEFLRHIGHQRVYRPKEEGDETAASEERYLDAVRRFRAVKKWESDSKNER